MSKYYIFLILLIVISLITGIVISIIEKKLKREIEAVEGDLQTKTSLNLWDVSLLKSKLDSKGTATDAKTCFNTTFFAPPIITSETEDTKEFINKPKNDEVDETPILISSEFCEEILEDSEREDII